MNLLSEEVSTRKHIDEVRKLLNKCIKELLDRANNHDASKLSDNELPTFTEVNQGKTRLKDLTYDSPEYKEGIAKLGKALKHHYSNNRHHPEHFDNGVNGMNLIDLLEMFCDWMAATKRHDDGDIQVSIARNKDRFKYDDQLAAIFTNTADFLGY